MAGKENPEAGAYDWLALRVLDASELAAAVELSQAIRNEPESTWLLADSGCDPVLGNQPRPHSVLTTEGESNARAAPFDDACVPRGTP
jgi:hypothetical protein